MIISNVFMYEMYLSKSFLRVDVFEIFKPNSRKMENTIELNQN